MCAKHDDLVRKPDLPGLRNTALFEDELTQRNQMLFRLLALGDYTNTATVAHPSGSTPPDNKSTAVIRVVAVAPPTPTPALDFKALVLLSFLMFAIGCFFARNRRMRG